MTLENEGSVCGLCEAHGHDVKHTPATFARLLQALDLSKLPPALTEPELGNKVGLCNKCECQIKLVEEAASIRENLKETLVSNLKHLSGSYASLHSFNNKAADCITYGQAFQQCNEITPDLHSMKRKLSNYSSDSQANRRKQLKTQYTNTLPLSPPTVITDHGDTSDDESTRNAVSRLVSPLSPHSSHGSYTPPPPNGSHQSSDKSQVLSELTCRNRRKQARPAKAAGEVVPPAVPQQLHITTPQQPSLYTNLRTTTPDHHAQIRSATPHRSTPPSRPVTPRRSVTPDRRPHSRGVSPVPPALTRAEIPSLPKVPPPYNTSDHVLPANLAPHKPQKSVSPSSSSAGPVPKVNKSQHSTPPTAAAPYPSLPFSSLYQNNLPYNLNPSLPQSTSTAFLLAQSIFNQAAASKNPMLGLNNPLSFLSQGIPQLSNLPTMPPTSSASANPLQQFSKAFLPQSVNYGDMSKVKNSGKHGKTTLTTKPEPVMPAYKYNMPKGTTNSASNGAASLPALKKTTMTGNGMVNSAIAADTHTLVKTDKRRYCKVCAASCRKANNGRPPQSRFLCLACNMPMCRSCIEEHRYRIMMKLEEPSGSASAKLLKAVKMKQESKSPSVSPSAPKLPALSSKPGISSSTPPSHSSLIFGTNTSTPVSLSQSAPAGTLPAMPSLIGLPSPKNPTDALDMSIPGYKAIAPAPPKLTNMSPKLSEASADIKPVDLELGVEECQEELAADKVSEVSEAISDDVPISDDDEEEGVLIISEHSESVEGDNHSGEITPELASQTAAMLASMDNDDSMDSHEKEMLLNNQPLQPATEHSSSSIPDDVTPTLPSIISSSKNDCTLISEKTSTIPPVQPRPLAV